MSEIFERYGRDIGTFCRMSRTVCAEYFGKSSADMGLDHKADDSPVTVADREIERRMRDYIEKKYPDHGVVGEEAGSTNEKAEFVWVLDPIDGTKSFISGVPLFGTLIALMHEGRPILGAIYLPVQDELLLGDNNETLLNGRPTRMRPCERLGDAVLLSTDVMHAERYRELPPFLTLARKVNFLRTWGDAWGYALLARGSADIMMDAIMNPWDIMALIPVIRGAGGVITDWYGGDPVKGDSIVAASSAMHGAVLEILGGN